MTATLDTLVASSHTIAVDCYALFNRVPVGNPLAIVAGSVTLDRTAAQRGRCSITLAEPLLIPGPSGGPLTPYGAEIGLRRGVVHADGTKEMGPLGIFPIQSSKLDGVTLVTDIEATDRSQLVVDARLEDDYAVAAGINYGDAIRALIDAGVPGLTYNFVSTSYATPALVFTAQADRWDAARGMAKSIGCELFFNGLGQCVMQPEVQFTTSPRWTISEGEGGVLLGASLALDRASAYNAVIATGENTGVTTVPRGTWYDNNPGSPTYYSGPFGKKPRFFASTFITTPEQAVSAATAIGSAQQGVARSLDFQSVCNPSMVPGDLILVRRLAMGVNEIHQLDSTEIPLTADGAQTGSSRWGATTDV